MDLNIEDGVFEFSGISNIENATSFEPTFDAIDRYLESPKDETRIVLQV